MVDQTFAPLIVQLANDPVPNIRFNVSKTIQGLFPQFSPANQSKIKEVLARLAENDGDFDSKFYAQKTLDFV